MLPQPIFGDYSLSQSLYCALINRLPNGLNYATQNLLSECNFSIAPNPAQGVTFFIIAPSLLVAEQLILDMDSLKGRINALMGEIGQIGICLRPASSEIDTAIDCRAYEENLPQYMMCKFFPL